MQQQHNEGVGYNGHTVIQPLSHSFKVGKPPNSLFLDTMDFLTMEVVGIVWAAGCWAAVINGPTSALPCLSLRPTLLPAGVSGLHTTQHTAHIIITSKHPHQSREHNRGLMAIMMC